MKGDIFMKIVYLLLAGFGILMVLVVLSMVVMNNRVPKNLGVENGKLAEMPSSPNAVSTQAIDEEKKVEPLPFKGDLIETKRIIEKIIEQYGSAKIVTNESHYIHAVFSTKTMKYKDDVEFYFDDSNKVIEFRSASRVGHSDMGLNRERYETIRELYNHY